MALIKHSARTRRDSGCNCHGDKNVYWAHDTDVTTDRHGYTLKHCTTCDVTGRFVLINANDYTRAAKPGSEVSESDRHNRKSDYTPEVEVEATDTEVTDTEGTELAEWEKDLLGRANPEPAAFTPASVAPDTRVDTLTAMVLDLTAQVGTLAAQIMPKRELPTLHHVMLSEVIIDLDSGEHVLMVGPAGTGKSNIAKDAAKVLGFRYYEISLNPGLTATSLLGYMTADGTYVRTLYREAYENGGVFHFDEFDNGHPSTLATANAGLANGEMAFPDGMIKRHADFRCVASANTFGRGPDRQYVGRQVIDAATLDRFTVEEILVDNALESAICEGLYTHAAKVVAYVRALRNNADTYKMSVIVSPRGSIGMCKLLAAGKAWDAAVTARLRKGLSDSDWSKLTMGVSSPVL